MKPAFSFADGAGTAERQLPVRTAMTMSLVPAAALCAAIGAAAGPAGAGEPTGAGGGPVKLLASFESGEASKWGWKEKDGAFSWEDPGGARGLAVKGEASHGEWALCHKINTQNRVAWTNAGPQDEWLRYFHGGLSRWAGHFRKWFPTDWSGYARLRMDLKSTKATVTVRVELWDEIALPPAIRVFHVPAGEWVTLDYDLAAASAVRDMALSERAAKFYGAPKARLRMFNPARMANMIVVVEKTEGQTDLYLDNVRLLKAEDSEAPRFKLLTDPRPWPEPKELPPSEPSPREPVAGWASPAAAPMGKAEPFTIDISSEKGHSYGKLGEMVKHAVTAADREKLVFAQSDFSPKVSLDGGKTWRALGNLRHSTNAPGVGVAAAGPDLIGVYSARCACGGAPTDTFFRELRFDGAEWKAGAPHLVDVDSWHCPEFKVEVLRLKSGRIWAAWFQDGRTRSIHLKARYSDDGGITWRDPDSNGLAVYENRQHTKGPLPIGVTWWWEDPPATPPVEKANGRIGPCHPHANLVITPYGEHLAAIWGLNDREMAWSRFDGKEWSKPRTAMMKFGSPAAATTLGEKEIYFTFDGKVWRLDGENWVEDSPAEKGPWYLCVSGKTLVCIGKKAAKEGGKQLTELWSSRKTSGGKWSAPEVFAREETPADREGEVYAIAPQFAPEGFVPVAWGLPGRQKPSWIRFAKLPAGTQ